MIYCSIKLNSTLQLHELDEAHQNISKLKLFCDLIVQLTNLKIYFIGWVESMNVWTIIAKYTSIIGFMFSVVNVIQYRYDF